MGFRTIDCLVQRFGARTRKPPFKRFIIGKARSNDAILYLVKPLTFMNNSGEAVKQALKYTGAAVSDLVVVCDSLDLPVGDCRLKKTGSSAGQKGLESIIKALGTKEFMRLSIGIGRPFIKSNVIDYVLSVPPGSEHKVLEKTIDRAAEGILQLANEGPERVMNVLNQPSS